MNTQKDKEMKTKKGHRKRDAKIQRVLNLTARHQRTSNYVVVIWLMAFSCYLGLITSTKIPIKLIKVDLYQLNLYLPGCKVTMRLT